MTTAVQNDREIKCFTNSIVTIPEALGILGDNEEVPAGNVCWRILSKDHGDKRVVWDATSIPQISEARRLFDKLKQEGMVAYRVGVDGQASSEEMKEFDPYAEEVLFLQMRHVVGG